MLGVLSSPSLALLRGVSTRVGQACPGVLLVLLGGGFCSPVLPSGRVSRVNNMHAWCLRRLVVGIKLTPCPEAWAHTQQQLSHEPRKARVRVRCVYTYVRLGFTPGSRRFAAIAGLGLPFCLVVLGAGPRRSCVPRGHRPVYGTSGFIGLPCMTCILACLVYPSARTAADRLGSHD